MCVSVEGEWEFEVLGEDGLDEKYEVSAGVRGWRAQPQPGTLEPVAHILPISTTPGST